MMSADDDHWPSLPPIRTSSYNSRVSCETLNLYTPPATSSTTHAHTPSSSSFKPKPASKSADASPFCSQTTSPSPVFSSCFPHKFPKGHGRDRKKGATQAHGGVFDATGLLRSIFGFSSPMVSFTSGASPSNWQTPPSMTSSPSGRMKPSGATSPISSMRSGAATPHQGVLLRSSKGHSAHTHAFTMMPPDVVGRKKPLGYESDEPKSPEVTCIGKVRRKHCKATWDALVKEKHKDAKKKGKVKKLTGEIPRKSDVGACGNMHEGGESTATAKLSRQRSETRRSLDFEGFLTDLSMHLPRHGDPTKVDLTQGMDNAYNNQAPTGSRNGDEHTHSEDCTGCDLPSCSKSQSGILEVQPKLSSWQGEGFVHEHHGDFEASLYDKKPESDAPALSSETLPPSNCLLLMKKGSRNRSAHYHFDQQLAQEPGYAINQWNWGQVLT